MDKYCIIKKVFLDRKNSFFRNMKTIVVLLLLSNLFSFTTNDAIEEKKSAGLISKNTQQNSEIRGRIVDERGNPIPGVTVVIIGTTIGTTTDVDGNYYLNNLPANAIIQFSFIGMKTQEIPVGNQTSINITMAEESIGLNEVVAIGYGVQRKVSITNAVSSITSKDLSERNSTNVVQALQGKLPGLTIIDKGGAPGKESLTARIRGVTSLNDNNPLILIDGIPGSLSTINPIDIESVSVLKDAASTAIYGSRAAAGVILVTTKAPTEGKLTITYDGYWGVSRSNNNPIHMDAVTYMKQQNAAYMNTYGYKFYEDEYIQKWSDNHTNDPEKYPNPNTWQDFMFKIAPKHSHTIVLGGGNERITNRVSFRYMDEKGILPNYGFNLSELRAKNAFKINKKTSFDTNINIRLSENQTPANEWLSFNRIWQNSQWAVPLYNDGSYGLSVDSFSPLLAAQESGLNKTKNIHMTGVFNFDYEIVNRVTLNAQYSLQHNVQTANSFINKYDFKDKLHPGRRMFNLINKMTDNRGDTSEEGFDLKLKYDNNFNKHKINGIAGYSQIRHKENWVKGYRQNFYNNYLQALSMGANDATQSATGGNSKWGLKSFFSRLNYEYDSKYLFEANARYDGSSRFAKGYRYGFFPSFSMGWRISNEKFWTDLKNTFEEFKIRGSWGKVGSQQVELYTYMPTYSQQNYIFNESPASGYRQINVANEDISWETTTQLNFGLDGYLFNNRLNFSLDYYSKLTTDILLMVPIPSITGLQPSSQNAGSVENKGFEFLIGGHKSLGDFDIAMNFNVNYNQNKVLDLAGTGPHILGGGSHRTITTEGKPIASYYGFLIDGFFQTQEEVDRYAKWDGAVGPGDVKYLDLNNDGQLTPADFAIFGNEMPDWTFSSKMTVSWKHLTLDLFWQGVAGSDKLMTGAILEHGIWGGFTHKIWEDYWTPENRNAKFPRPTKHTMRNVQISDFTMLNGSYLRLKNIRLSYKIPQKICNKLKINTINTYITTTNLITFSELNKYNIDPEMENRDQERNFPQTSVTTIGININF